MDGATQDFTWKRIITQEVTAMVEIKLERETWYYDPESPLGEKGGFGRVFVGHSKSGQVVAIKELMIDAKQGARRELQMADELVGAQYAHVVPIYDSGYDVQRSRFFVVMAKADRSLQDELQNRGRVDENATATILLQIARGLAEVAHITHRDLKPANILWHEGSWKIADFGIARFVEEATASQTLKGFLSSEYGAPEQWLGERAAGLTDVYALGCIGYALLLGHAPFAGPNYEAQHRREKPPSLPGQPDQLRTLLLKMLSKAPGARPDRDRVINELNCYLSEGGLGENQPGIPLLQMVGVREAKKAAEQEAEKEVTLRAEELENARRVALAKSGEERFQDLTRILFDVISSLAPSAKDAGQHPAVLRGWRHYQAIQLGQARLDVLVEDRLGPIPRGVFKASGWDVIWGAKIEVCQQTPAYKWGSSLWYTNAGTGSNYRWYEVSYYSSATVKHSSMFEPYALDPQEADAAVGPSMTVNNVAFGPCAIDDEATDAFARRWGDRLALAVDGKLSSPRYFPLQGNA